MINNQRFIAIANLTGTNRDAILNQTKELLRPPMPAKGTPEYETFLRNLKESPANGATTTAEQLRINAGWNIDSSEHFQDYLNQFNGAPFVSSVGSGTCSIYESVHTIDELMSTICKVVNATTVSINAISDDYDLENWFNGNSEGDDKKLQIIVQELQSSAGNLSLIVSSHSLIIGYTSPANVDHSLNKPNGQPTYKVTGTGMSVQIGLPSDVFSQYADQILESGLTNVIEWASKNMTPASCHR